MAEANPSRSVDEIFDEAVQRPAGTARDAYLDEVCGCDSELRKRVERLLQAEGEANSFLEAPALDSTPPGDNSRITEQPGTMIDDYRLLQQIGEGGFGVVYMAEQLHPVKRKVAVKVIKPGMDTKEVVARFEAERQALAMMDHANIARVFDGGITDSGRPYFVMELVKGVALNDFCDTNRLPVEDRLELFGQICRAIQHAHQKGVIHRDIKPSNVMVTLHDGIPLPKVIDFGVAKAISHELTDKTMFTAYGQMIGTPQYMSPEQAEMSALDVDTRSDVYSLGVLLYELLTGTTPLGDLNVQRTAYDELCRQIREVEAPKPSARVSTLEIARLSTVAEQRQVEPQAIQQMLSGDLDRVVLKALEKDRERRYETPKELAADVERFLDDKPVLAVPPSPWYLARKYMRRHNAAIVTAVTILSFLVIATLFSSWQAIRATAASKIAAEKTAAAERSEGAALDAKQDAETARKNAVASGDRAKKSAEAQRRMRYAADMQLANQLWHVPSGKPTEIAELLSRWIHDEPDLRDFVWRHQWTRLHEGAERTIRGVSGVAFSQDGQLVVVDKANVRKWNPTTQRFLPIFEKAELQARSRLKLSPCGQWAAILPKSGDTDGETQLRLASLIDGKTIFESRGNRIKFSCGGEYLLAWTNRPDTQPGHELWQLATGTKSELPPDVAAHLATANRHPSAISVDGKSFLFVDDMLHLRAHLQGRASPFYRRYQYAILTSAFSPDGTFFAEGQFTGIVKVRMVQNPTRSVEFKAHGTNVLSLAFSPDSRHIAVGLDDGVIEVWDVTSHGDTVEAAYGQTLKGHLSEITKVVFSADNLKLASLDKLGTAKLWDLQADTGLDRVTTRGDDLFGWETGIHLKQSPKGVRVSALTPEFHEVTRGKIQLGDRVVGITDQGIFHAVDSNTEHHDVRPLLHGPHKSVVEIHLKSADQQRRVAELQRLKELVPRVHGLSYSPDGSSIAVADYFRGAVMLTSDGRPKKRFPIRGISAEFSPDGRYLALDDKRTLSVWDLHTQRFYAQWETALGATPTPTGGYWGTVTFSPEGKYIALGTGYRYNNRVNRSELRVWDVTTRMEITDGPLLTADRVIAGLAFTPDGQWLLGASHGGKLRIWNTSNWKLQRELESEQATSVAISPSGKNIALGGIGLQVLDFESGSTHYHIDDLSAFALAFSPDGRTLIATGVEGEVVLIDVETGMRLSTLSGHSDMVCACDFSPDGKTLATIDAMGNLRFWKANALEEIDKYPITAGDRSDSNNLIALDSG